MFTLPEGEADTQNSKGFGFGKRGNTLDVKGTANRAHVNTAMLALL